MLLFDKYFETSRGTLFKSKYKLPFWFEVLSNSNNKYDLKTGLYSISSPLKFNIPRKYGLY